MSLKFKAQSLKLPATPDNLVTVDFSCQSLD